MIQQMREIIMLVLDVEELYFKGFSDQSQLVSILVVRAMVAVRWLEVKAGAS